MLCNDDHSSLTPLGTTSCNMPGNIVNIFYSTNMAKEKHSNSLPEVVVIKFYY